MDSFNPGRAASPSEEHRDRGPQPCHTRRKQEGVMGRARAPRLQEQGSPELGGSLVGEEGVVGEHRLH